MTCARAINLARRHAALCDEIERTAPAVHATKLREAIERASLNISVRYFPDLDEFCIEWGYPTIARDGEPAEVVHVEFYETAEQASGAYLATCALLSEVSPPSAPTILPASTGDGAVLAGASASASLFESAAPTSGASSLADKTGAETPSASVANSGGC